MSLVPRSARFRWQAADRLSPASCDMRAERRRPLLCPAFTRRGVCPGGVPCRLWDVCHGDDIAPGFSSSSQPQFQHRLGRGSGIRDHAGRGNSPLGRDAGTGGAPTWSTRGGSAPEGCALQLHVLQLGGAAPRCAAAVLLSRRQAEAALFLRSPIGQAALRRRDCDAGRQGCRGKPSDQGSDGGIDGAVTHGCPAIRLSQTLTPVW